MLLVALALLISGCEPAHDEDSLVRRVNIALGEVGADPLLTRCLTKDLASHLSETDAERAYEGLASDPEVTERSLNRVSLVEQTVKERLLERARICRSSLISHGRYTRGEVDRMLRRVGARGYLKPRLFLEG